MSDVLVIVPPDLAEGFLLAGARVWTATSPGEARARVQAALEDARAGVVGVAEVYFAALDAPIRRAIERRYRPVVVPLPMPVGVSAEDRRQAELQEVIRRAVGLRVVLGGARHAA